MNLCDVLESRVLMAATPLDPTFGTGGKAASLDGGASHVLATGDAIYVESTRIDGNSDRRLLYKYTSAGKLDASWGGGGQVALPMEMTQIAYDQRTGLLYTAGNGDGSADAPKVMVMRFTRTGQFDSTFGTDGIAGYTPVSTAANTQTATSITKILPVAGKGLMVGFTLSAYSRDEDDSAVLMKLRGNGTRDPGFGRSGKVTLLGGYEITTAGGATEGPYAYNYASPRITDLVEQPQGIRVVLTRATGTSHGSDDFNSDSSNETFQIKLRTVFASGTVDTGTAYSWTLLKPLTTGGNTFQTMIARYDGKNAKHDNVSVIGEVTTYDASSSSTGKVSHTATEPYLFSIAPGVRASPRRLDRRLTGVTAVYSATPGIYFAAVSGAVVKTSFSGANTTGFADGGVAFLAKNASPLDVDPNGGLLLIAGSTLERIV